VSERGDKVEEVGEEPEVRDKEERCGSWEQMRPGKQTDEFVWQVVHL
jgi:hypothetical protein